MNSLMEMLPAIPFHNSRQYKIITEIQEKYLNKKEIDIEDLEKQLIIDTATWGLVIYEMELGLITDSNKSLSERRSNIKAKMLGVGKVGADLIETIAKSFINGAVKVSFDGDIIIDLKIKNQPIIDLNPFVNILEEIKPAHLGYKLNSAVEIDTNTSIGATTLSGADITVYPYMDDLIETTVNAYIPIALNSQKMDTTIYPKGVIK